MLTWAHDRSQQLFTMGGMSSPQDTARAARDAGATRERLVAAASQRFAADGYRGTTVRRIAEDASANVALINRYFGGKEGLFEACISRMDTDADPLPMAAGSKIERIVARLVEQATAPSSSSGRLTLMLLLRSTGDVEADALSRRALDRLVEGIAAAAGWDPENPSTQHVLARARIGLATTAGLVLLRETGSAEASSTEATTSGSTDLESSAGSGDLADLLHDMLTELLVQEPRQ